MNTLVRQFNFSYLGIYKGEPWHHRSIKWMFRRDIGMYIVLADYVNPTSEHTK